MLFSYMDGRIESVCPRTDDDAWAINIRRGILSTLQNTMSRLQGLSRDREIDIVGNCPVKYEVTASSSQIIKVKKTKELLGCTERQDAQTIFQGMPYKTDSDVQSMPLIASTHSCEQEVNSASRIIVKSKCSETHSFRPFAKMDSGATTEVTYTMTFVRQFNINQRPDGARRIRSTMLYDHTLSAEQTASMLTETQQTFQQLCEKTRIDIRPEVPALFTKLVHQMRRLDTQSLRQLMYAIKRSPMCSKAEKFYRDALPLLGTGSAVSTMRQMITENQVTEADIDTWMSSVAFIKNPTVDMFRELKPLVSSNMMKASLSVSALINTYLKTNGDQKNNADIVQIIRIFESVLNFNCRTQSDEQTAKMLMALRAIGNAGLGAKSAIATLTRCAANEASPMSIRVAAIDAFRRIDCGDSNRNDLFTMFENHEADSELRINAYLAVMQCASEPTLRRVQAVLESDKINQVLSFVWTHLTNLRETASPLKRQIRAILENAELRKEYDMDKRKFSRNVELSTFSEMLNVGASVESNLIWSEQSFVPRSASLNLTVDMFGRSINLVEFGGRIQGVEDILEKLLGPGSDADNVIRQQRERRALVRDDMLNTIDRTFNKQTDPDQLSYYIRVFGNEIRAGDVFGFDFESLKNKFSYRDWLNELAKDHNYDITKSFLFLDANVIIPTGTGFPLNLNVEGSTTIGLSANGKIDVRQILGSPSAFDVNGSVKPSAATEIRASMGIDGQVASTGLKIVNTLHSSTVLDGVLRLRNGRVFDLDWNLPQDRIEIFSAESHVYVTYRYADREQTNTEQQSFTWKKCTSSDAAQMTGLEMCGELSVPKIRTGAIGSTVARVYINKLETYKGLHFDTSYTKSENDNAETVRISFNTPQSRVDRELTAEFTLRRLERQFQLNLKSPWKKVNVEGSFVNEQATKRIFLKAILDQVKEYSISAELLTVAGSGATRYSPTMTIVIPDRPAMTLEGTFNIMPKRYDVKVALKNAFRDPVTVDGYIQTIDKRSSVKYDVSMQIGAPSFKGILTGYTGSSSSRSMKTWASRAVMQYAFDGGRREQIIINHKIRDQSVSNLQTYSTDCSWMTTIWPNYNGQAGFELSYSPNSVRTKLEAGFDTVRKVTIITSGAHDFNGPEKKFNGLVKFTFPYQDADYEVKLDHVNNPDSLMTNATVRYGPDSDQQTANIDIGMRKDGDHPLSLTGEIRVQCPGGHEMRISETLVERAPREYANVAVVQWRRGHEMRIVSTYKMAPRHEITNEITSTTGLNAPIRINGHLLPNPNNAQGRFELVHDGKTYLADGSYSFVRGGSSADQFTARATGLLSIAGRSASITGEANRRDRQIGGKLETIVDGNQRYAIGGSATAEPRTPRFQIRVEWPGQNFAELNANAKCEERNWLTSTPNDVEMNAKFISSIDPIRDVSVSFALDKNANGYKVNGQLAASPRRQFAADVLLDGTKLTVTLTSPINGYRSIRSETSFDRRTAGGTFDHRTAWDGGKQVALRLAADASKTLVDAQMSFNSSFKDFEAISGNYRYNLLGERASTNWDFSWARGQQITLVSTMTKRTIGNSVFTGNGETTLTTPFSTLRYANQRWQFQMSPESFKYKEEYDGDGRKFAFDLDTSLRAAGTTRRYLGRFGVQVPVMYDWLQNTSASFDVQHDTRLTKSVGKMDLNYGRNRFGYEHDVNIEPSSAIVLKVKLMTPFQPVPTIGFSINNRRQGNGWTTNNELLMGSSGRIGLDGSYQVTGYNVDATLALTTPYRGLERSSATFRNQRQRDGSWATIINVEYAPGKQIAVDVKFGYESTQKIFEIDVRTPCPHLRQARAAAGYSGSARNFQASAELSHDSLGRDKIIATVSANTADLQNMNVQLTARTPFEDFASFSVFGRHIRDSREHSQSTASWELNRHRGSALVDMKARSLVDFDARYELEYASRRKLELTTTFKVADRIVASASFKSPFDAARTVTASFAQDGPIDNFRVAADLTHNGVNRYTTGLDFAARPGDIRTSLRLSTPHRRVSQLVYTFILVGPKNRFNLDTSFEVNGQKLSKTINFELDTAAGPTLRLVGKFDSPDPIPSIGYAVYHNGPLTNFENRLEIVIDGAQTTASGEFRLAGPSMKFDLKTPYRPLTALSLMHATKPGRSFAGWQNNAAIEINGNRYTGESNIGLRGQAIQGRAAVNLPQEYSIELAHNDNSDARNIDIERIVSIRLADRTLKGTVGLKNSPNLIDYKFIVETNYPGYERSEATFKHESTQAGFRTTVVLDTPLRQFPRASAQLTQRFTSRTDFVTSLDLQLPLRSVGHTTATLSHRGAPNDFTSELSILLNGISPISSTLTYKNNPRATEGTLVVQTPFEQLSRFTSEFRYTGQTPMSFVVTGKFQYASTVLPAAATPTSVRLEQNTVSRSQFRTVAELTIPAGKHTATLEHNGNPDNFRSSIKLETPMTYSEYRRTSATRVYEATVENGMQSGKPKTSITIRGPSSYQLTASKTGAPADMQLNAELKTPIDGLQRTAASYSGRVSWPTIVELRGIVETSVRNWERTSVALTHTGGSVGNFRSVGTIETSQRGYERMSAALSNAIDNSGAVKTTVQVENANAKYAASSDLSYKGRGGWRWASTVETPTRGAERWTTTVEHAPISNGFRTSAMMTTPVDGYQRFGAALTHHRYATSQFQTSVRLTLPPNSEAPQIDVTLTHSGRRWNDFATGLTFDNGNGKKIETSAMFRSRDMSFEAGAKLSTTACSYFTDFSINATHNRQYDMNNGALMVTVNGDKKVDFDYNYKKNGERSININVRSPQSVNTEMAVANDGQGSIVVNYDRNSQIRFDFGLTNIETAVLTDRYLTFRVTVPHYRRTVGFGAGYSASFERFANRAELYWDSDVQPDFVYEADLTKRGASGYEGRFKVVSGLFNTDSSFSHVVMPGGRRVKTEVFVDGTDMLTIKSDITRSSSNDIYSQIITVQHPKFTKDVTLTIDSRPVIFKTTLDYERQSWTLEWNRRDDSTSDGPKYASTLRLANPSAQLDVQLVTDYLSSISEGKVSTGAAIKYYMSRERQMKTLIGFNADINEPTKEIKLMVETPVDTMRFTTSNRGVDLESGIVRYDVTYESSRLFRRSTIDYSRADRTLDLKYYTAPDSFVEAYAQAISPTQTALELSHTGNANRITDVQITTSYSDDEHLATGRTFVRPDLSTDIRSYLDQLKSRISAYRAQLNTDLEAMTISMKNDGRIKSRALEQAVTVPIGNVVDYLGSSVQAKVDQIEAAADVMYRDNAFYMRDAIVAFKRSYEQTRQTMLYRTADLRRRYAEWSVEISEQLEYVFDEISQWNRDVQQSIANCVSDAVDRLQRLQPDFENIRPVINAMIDETKTKLTAFLDNLRRSQSFRNLVDRIAAMDPNDYILPPSQWQSKLEVFAARIDRWLQHVLSTPEAHYARDLLVRYMQKSEWFYKLIGLEQQFNEWIARVRSMNWDTIKECIRKCVTDYLQLEKTKWTVWDPEHGEFAAQAYIPFELPDYSTLSRFDPRPVMTQASDWVADQVPDEADLSLLDIAYSYKMPKDIRDLVPPFKGHASLTGAQHYMTFDRRFFEFAGECSYLLARDFIGGTFSVIVNYDRSNRGQPIKKSLTIVTAGRQVEVFPDGKVTVDGTRVEMPVRVGNATVLRRGNLISVVDDWRGVDVTCDLPHDHCTLSVSGWYYGKTAGLFGTYDNEPSNDFIKSDNAMAARPESSADSWTVGQRCQPINRAVVVQPDTTTRRYRACAELFVEARSSMFRPCFKTVDPASFLTMCLNDVAMDDNSLAAETDVCRPAAAYVHECRQHDISLRMPKQCVRCEMPNNGRSFYEMETITLDNEKDIPRVADVVFVIQHAPCNRDVIDKIASLADSVDKAMRAEGLTSTRFAVVGFGGKKSHMNAAHVHTMDGQIFNTARKMSLAIDNFDFEADSNPDAMLALSYMAHLPFRAGASKTAILIGCDTCRERSIKFSDIQRIMLNNDIHLHVLVQEAIRLKSRSPKAAYIYGTDQSTVYTRKDVAGDELAGEPDLRRYVRLPKDLCVALTMDTDGSVFSVRQWLDSRPMIQKQFVDVMIRTLARKAQPTECQICQCIPDEAQVGISQCHSCYRRDPFYWLPPTFEDDDEEADIDGDDDDDDENDGEIADADNSSRVTVDSQAPVTQAPMRRPPRPSRRRRPNSRVNRRPIAVRPPRPRRMRV